MIKELFIIWDPIKEQAFYYDTYREFVMEIQKLENNDFQVWTFEILIYDEEYIDVAIWFDGELFISDHETWEDLRELVYRWKYNFDKARIYNLNQHYLKLNFRS